MEKDLKKSFVQGMFRFKKSGMDFPKILDANIKELYLMSSLSDEVCGVHQSVDLSEIKEHMHITKAAVSQMFTALEKKGYVIRETDKTNRRKITVALTFEGKRVLKLAQTKADNLLGETLNRMGEDNAWQLIALINQFSDISDAIKQEHLLKVKTSLTDPVSEKDQHLEARIKNAMDQGSSKQKNNSPETKTEKEASDDAQA